MTKKALITGGSSGLGLALAKSLLDRGYDVVLLARDKNKLDATRVALLAIYPQRQVHIFVCDVSDHAALTTTFDSVKESIGSLDFLVLNAGVTTVDLLEDYTNLREVARTVEINLVGAIGCTYLGLPLLHAGARILFISSGFALVGGAGYSLYSASKAGLYNFADAIRRELLPRGIHVHVACPGDIDTPMYTAELETMPDWITAKTGRATPMSAELAAQYILRDCFRGIFRIITSSDVKLLLFLQRVLPHRLYMLVLDNILPIPPSGPQSSVHLL